MNRPKRAQTNYNPLRQEEKKPGFFNKLNFFSSTA